MTTSTQKSAYTRKIRSICRHREHPQLYIKNANIVCIVVGVIAVCYWVRVFNFAHLNKMKLDAHSHTQYTYESEQDDIHGNELSWVELNGTHIKMHSIVVDATAHCRANIKKNVQLLCCFRCKTQWKKAFANKHNSKRDDMSSGGQKTNMENVNELRFDKSEHYIERKKAPHQQCLNSIEANFGTDFVSFRYKVNFRYYFAFFVDFFFVISLVILLSFVHQNDHIKTACITSIDTFHLFCFLLFLHTIFVLCIAPIRMMKWCGVCVDASMPIIIIVIICRVRGLIIQMNI